MKALRRTVLILFSGLFGGCFAAPETNTERIIPPRDAEFVILATCNTSGWIEPCGCASGQSGGLSRRATLMKRLAGDREKLIVSCGGAASGDTPYDREKFKAILDGEVAIGYELHNLGTSEFETDLRFVHGLTFVATNAKIEYENCVRSRMITKSGCRLLVLGVSGDSEGTASAEAEILQQIERHRGRFDSVVVLAYVDREQLFELANRLPEVDVLIGGNTNGSVSPQFVGRTLVTAVSNNGKFIARVTARKSGQTQVVSWTADLHEVTSEIEEDPDQLANLNRFRKRLGELDFSANQTHFVSKRSEDVTLSFAGTDSCEVCHGEDHRLWNESAHSHAWTTLVSKGAHVDPDCQRCHTTGYGFSGGFIDRKNSVPQKRVDVGCESCHGPSDAHVKDPKKKTPWQPSETCLSCHDHENSPLFEYDSYWEKIAHGEVTNAK